MEREHHDVVILGGGLAGLTLARHLLLETDKTVLLLEKRDVLPMKHQKVGESSVQVAGYYFSRILDLEDTLWRQQFMKYNLRFYWKSPGGDPARFEDYTQTYIRPFSNIASYQLDRNVFEADLLRRNREDPRFTIRLGVSDLDVELAEDGPHAVRFTSGGETRGVRCTWLVDTTGRRRLLARRENLAKPNEIRHGAFFWWVDGLVDVDRLTDRPRREIRLKPSRRHLGHLPSWLATNHFCDEGLWFWVIPLQGKTSLGLVFDKEVIDHHDVFTVEKATRWVCERFPCFAHDLPQRKVLDFSGLADFSHDCQQTIDPSRWALAGEAGRFTDPLYSPGSDLIAIYNTLIVDAVRTDDRAELAEKCALYEQLMRAVYQAYVPSYAHTYCCLGDAETFTLKYTWELTIYFAFYVFPFINDFFVERRFLIGFLRAFAKLGPLNLAIQRLLADYYRWKKAELEPVAGPVFHDFTSLGPLAAAEKCFYEVGVSVDEGKRILGRQLDNVEELARFVAVWIASVVLGDERALTDLRFVAAMGPGELRFEPDAWRRRWAAGPGDDTHRWSFDPYVLRHFRGTPKSAEVPA